MILCGGKIPYNCICHTVGAVLEEVTPSHCFPWRGEDGYLAAWG